MPWCEHTDNKRTNPTECICGNQQHSGNQINKLCTGRNRCELTTVAIPDGYVTWTVTLATASLLTLETSTPVTQITGTIGGENVQVVATGTLAAALDGSSTTTLTLRSAIGQMFTSDSVSNLPSTLVIGDKNNPSSSTVTVASLSSVTKPNTQTPLGRYVSNILCLFGTDICIFYTTNLVLFIFLSLHFPCSLSLFLSFSLSLSALECTQLSIWMFRARVKCTCKVQRMYSRVDVYKTRLRQWILGQ